MDLDWYFRYGFAEGAWIGGETTETYYVATLPGDGSYTLYLQERDDVGNWSTSTTYEVILDRVAPTNVTVDPLVTNDDTPELTGTVDDEPLLAFSVTVSGQTNSAIGNGDGTWTLADNLLTALGEGTYDIQVTAYDEAGNGGFDGTTDELVIDLTPPTAPAVTGTTPTTDTTPTWSWTPGSGGNGQ